MRIEPRRTPPACSSPDRGRRRWVQALAAAPFLAAAGGLPPARAALKTRARIVIAGSGLGGIAVASRLAQLLDGATITIVDAKEEHNYQPGYTLVAAGAWSADKVRLRNADLQPAGVAWVKEMVAAFDPAGNAVVTASGRRIPYDFLVVATGVHLDYARIEGMDVAAIGREGLASVYAGPQAAQGTHAALQAVAQRGGEAVLTLPALVLKCAGAPLKMTFLVRDALREAGTLGRSQVQFVSAVDSVFGVKAVQDNVLARWRDLGIGVQYGQRLAAVDIGARRATFVTAAGERIERGYDFLHVVPPMRAPDVVLRSELAWKEGPFAAGGWLEVDPGTLQHRRHPNVFGIGDVNGTPRGKTAATVKKSAPIVAHNLAQVIEGKAPDQLFDGYTSCPLVTRMGSAMLIEFDYQGRFTPSLPFVDPLQESYLAWLMKERMLQPAYLAVLKGRV